MALHIRIQHREWTDNESQIRQSYTNPNLVGVEHVYGGGGTRKARVDAVYVYVDAVYVYVDAVYVYVLRNPKPSHAQGQSLSLLARPGPGV